MNENHNPRDHDLPPSPLPVEGEVPVLVRVNEPGAWKCPCCGCITTCEIQIKLQVPKFASGVGIGRYTGCPACEYASPMDVAGETENFDETLEE